MKFTMLIIYSLIKPSSPHRTFRSQKYFFTLLRYLVQNSNSVCIRHRFNAARRSYYIWLHRKFILNWLWRKESSPSPVYSSSQIFNNPSHTRKLDIKRYRKILFSVEVDGWEGSVYVDSELNFSVEDPQLTKIPSSVATATISWNNAKIRWQRWI